MSCAHRETISLQDKKRAYVECMEQYIEFLHAQLRLVGHEPVAMQKAGGYSGMNTRSIRVRHSSRVRSLISLASQTLAVHMQTVVRQAQVRVLNEERTVGASFAMVLICGSSTASSLP
jgi:hypothetical protein